MKAISRRRFLGAAASLSAAQVLYADPLGLPIGSQTYPHRQRIKDGDFAGLCKDMADLGIRNIELCSPGYAEFASLSDGKQVRRILDDHGLQCPSSHFNLRSLRTKLPEMIAWAHDIGMTQMGTASLSGPMQNGVTTMDAVKKAADEYNNIAAETAKAGLQQFLHDEGFEMSKVEDGRLTYQVLLELLDSKLVKMQFQMSSRDVVGDPVMYFNKYPGRFISMHLQGDTSDWPRIFAAAKTGGLRNYFVEQSWDLTVQTVAYLKRLKV